VRHLPGQLLRALIWRTAPALAFAALIALALLLRAQSILRRLFRRRPRVVWGPDPIINIKYWSQALRARGYESTTCVYNVYAIHTREDFDRHRDEFLPRFAYGDLYRDYAVFAWALRNADVFMFFLNGGFLRWTPLRNREAWLLRLAGRRLVVFPYGGDIAVPGHLGPAEEALLRDYPEFVETAEAVTERVDYFARWADVMIRNYQYGYLPRADILWPTMLAIDTDEWSEAPAAASDRDGGPVVIVHAPNHRHIKGTARLIEVVEELRSEGTAIELDLIEGRPNHEVREAVRSADIVGDQFIAGYAMFAIEGMASGKPVLSALAWMDPEVRETEALRACPIVDADLETLKEKLRGLATNAKARRELGAAGRQFALDYHSYEAVSDGWEAILDHLWGGAPLPRQLPPVGQPPVAAERSASRHSTTERSPSR
jgi:glycosyltransferase involved in cell wall biosynthesis